MAHTNETHPVNGDNFSPAFLRSTSQRAPTVTVLTSNKVQPKATLPVLVLPLEITVDETIPTKYRAVTNTIDVVSFLDTATLSSSFSAPSLSPATVQGSNDAKALIERVHAPDAPDPNALLLSFRDDSERKAKLDQIAGPFLRGRIAAIEKFAAENDPKLAAFYAQKLQARYSLSLDPNQIDTSETKRKTNTCSACLKDRPTRASTRNRRSRCGHRPPQRQLSLKSASSLTLTTSSVTCLSPSTSPALFRFL